MRTGPWVSALIGLMLLSVLLLMLAGCSKEAEELGRDTREAVDGFFRGLCGATPLPLMVLAGSRAFKRKRHK